MPRTSKNKSWSGRSQSRFSNQQLIKPHYSSQIHKTKRKASGKKGRNYQPLSPKKTQYVLDLERQVAQMQRRLKAVEEKLEAETPERPRSRSRYDFNESRARRTEEETIIRRSRSSCKRKRRTAGDSDDGEDLRAHKVAFIHVGEGGERDLEDHLRGSRSVNLQIVSSERLPDIDATDVIHGLDSSGTSRDYVDESHRCNATCPVGCQGHLRPNEIIIYESTRFNGRLFERKRLRGRFVHGASASDERYVSLDMADFRRIGGGRDRVRRRSERSREDSRRRELSPGPLVRAQGTRHRPHREHRHRESRREVPDTTPAPSHLRVDVAVPQKLAILLDSPEVSKQESLEHGWSATDKSFNIVLKEEDPRVMRRHPIAQSTDCIRGTQGYSSGLHMWQVNWPARQRGTHAVIGVATSDAPLHAVGYQSLVGNTDKSWGWDLGRLKAFHNNLQVGENYPAGLSGHTHHGWTVPTAFTMILDMDLGRLGFCVRDKWLGWAMTGLLASAPVFPIASTVWGHCEIELKYLHGLQSGVPSIQSLVRNVIRKTINGDTESVIKIPDTKIDELPLPGAIKKYVKDC